MRAIPHVGSVSQRQMGSEAEPRVRLVVPLRGPGLGLMEREKSVLGERSLECRFEETG